MINQLKVERFKFHRNPVFYMVAAILFLAGFFHGIIKLHILQNTDEVLKCVISDTSFLFMISLTTAMFVGSDFNNRTIYNEIKIGYSRLSIFASRMIYISIISVLLHTIFILSTVIGYIIRNGFDSSILSMRNLMWLITVMLQIISVQSITGFIIFTLKRAAVSVPAAVCFTFITCNIIRNFTDSRIFTLSCFCLAQDNSPKLLLSSSIYALPVFCIASALTYIIFKRAEV